MRKICIALLPLFAACTGSATLDIQLALLFGVQPTGTLEGQVLPTFQVRLIDSTRLAYVYPNIVEDLNIALRSKRQKPIQRILSFTQPDGKRIPMMSWLTPEADDNGKIVRFFGYVHPLGE